MLFLARYVSHSVVVGRQPCGLLLADTRRQTGAVGVGRCKELFYFLDFDRFITIVENISKDIARNYLSEVDENTAGSDSVKNEASFFI